MIIRFETCDRQTALGFIKEIFDAPTITGEEPGVKEFLDLVEKDIIRVPDPKMHGKRVGIYPSKNYSKAIEQDVILAATKMQEYFKDKK